MSPGKSPESPLKVVAKQENVKISVLGFVISKFLIFFVTISSSTG